MVDLNKKKKKRKPKRKKRQSDHVELSTGFIHREDCSRIDWSISWNATRPMNLGDLNAYYIDFGCDPVNETSYDLTQLKFLCEDRGWYNWIDLLDEVILYALEIEDKPYLFENALHCVKHNRRILETNGQKN